MLAYLVNFIHAFLPLSLVAGTLAAFFPPDSGKKTYRSLIIAIACGALAGCVIYPVALRQETATATRAVLYGVALAAALISAALLAASANRRRWWAVAWGTALSFTAALAAVSAYSFSAFIAEQTVSTSSVLNTEAILNIGGILAGLALIAFLIPLTAHMGVRNGKGAVTGVLLSLSTLLAVQWSADLLLGMMRMEAIELTSARISFVAKIGKYAGLLPYLCMVMIAALSLAFFLKRPVVTAAELAGMEMAERRKRRNSVLLELRWLRGALASVLIALTLLLYHDLYASRPPRISKPVRLMPDANGLIKVNTEELADGNLHRYAYVTDDGHVVRFFMINRSGGKKIGVVYDACMLCGDMGYLQEKNEVICIACNVRIFIPSIGKAGGCNPIPLPHRIDGGQVLVSVQELDKGARYFSEVVTVKVKDPVSGREIISRDAPQRYEYKGRTYFFESTETLERFKVKPESYIGEQESRYFRTQGFQGA